MPENAYPIPVEDCYKVTKYLIHNHDEFNFDINKIVLIGDSAGLPASKPLIRILEE